MQSRRPLGGDPLLGHETAIPMQTYAATSYVIKDLSIAPTNPGEFEVEPVDSIQNLSIGNGDRMIAVIRDGQYLGNSESKGSWSLQRPIWCSGVILAIVLIAAIFATVGSVYYIMNGKSSETFFSRTQAFDINLINEVVRSTYAQTAQAQVQWFELYRNQMLCLAALQCERYNDAYASRTGVSIECNYEEAVFDMSCPIPPGAITPFTYIGPNHTITGGDVRSVFNHRSSSSANFQQVAHSLEIRGSPTSTVGIHRNHHRPGGRDQEYYDAGSQYEG